MAIDRVSILSCVYCVSFSILRLDQVGQKCLELIALMGLLGSISGVSALSCSQQDVEFTSWHRANILIWPELALANTLATISPATCAFCFKPVCLLILQVYGSVEKGGRKREKKGEERIDRIKAAQVTMSRMLTAATLIFLTVDGKASS